LCVALHLAWLAPSTSAVLQLPPVMLTSYSRDPRGILQRVDCHAVHTDVLTEWLAKGDINEPIDSMEGSQAGYW